MLRARTHRGGNRDGAPSGHVCPAEKQSGECRNERFIANGRLVQAGELPNSSHPLTRHLTVQEVLVPLWPISQEMVGVSRGRVEPGPDFLSACLPSKVPSLSAFRRSDRIASRAPIPIFCTTSKRRPWSPPRLQQTISQNLSSPDYPRNPAASQVQNSPQFHGPRSRLDRCLSPAPRWCFGTGLRSRGWEWKRPNAGVIFAANSNGGEGGIRTLGTPFGVQTISNRLHSATLTPLHSVRRLESVRILYDQIRRFNLISRHRGWRSPDFEYQVLNRFECRNRNVRGGGS